MGDDVYFVDNTLDVLTENLNEGEDTVYSQATTFTLGANVENLTLVGLNNISGTGNTLNNVIYGNAVMRRKFGLAQRLAPSASPFNLVKMGLARFAKQSNWYPPSLKTRAITFHVEPAAPNAVREIVQAAA